MIMSKVNETAVGLLFFGALIGLGALTIFLSDFSLFETKYDVTVLFDDASGLEEGDNVLVMGTVQGKVQELDFFRTPKKVLKKKTGHWVAAVLRMNIPLESYLNSDYTIRIRNSNLLGSKVVDVELGNSGDLLAEGTALTGKAVGDPLEQISDLITDNRDRIDSSLENFERFTDDLTTASNSLISGDGILTSLLYDKKLTGRVNNLVSTAETSVGDLSEVIGQVKNGKGPLGRLLFDKKWSSDVTATLRSARNTFARIEETAEHVKSGRGPIGYLLFSEEAEREIGNMVSDISDIAGKVRSGKGVLGMLLYDESTARKVENLIAGIDDTVTGIREMIEHAQNGGGALGLLLSDEAVRSKLSAILDQALLALEDAREAAPLTSIGSYLLGSF